MFPAAGVSESIGRGRGGELEGLARRGEVGHLEGTWVNRAQKWKVRLERTSTGRYSLGFSQREVCGTILFTTANCRDVLPGLVAVEWPRQHAG